MVTRECVSARMAFLVVILLRLTREQLRRVLADLVAGARYIFDCEDSRVRDQIPRLLPCIACGIYLAAFITVRVPRLCIH